MALPYIKLYPGDYFRDTHHLNAEQHGIYLLLLMRQWQLGWLPDDNRQLAAICHISDLRHWKAVSPPVLAFFDRVDGRLVQPRMAGDRDKAERRRADLSRYGAEGVKAKALKTKERDEAQANHRHKPTGVGDNTESKTHSESQKESLYVTTEEFETWFAVYPRQEGRKMALAAYWAARKHASTDELLRQAGRYATAMLSQPQRYVMMPAKWLDGERWKDRYEEKPRIRKKSRIEEAADEIMRERGLIDEEQSNGECSNIIDLAAARN